MQQQARLVHPNTLKSLRKHQVLLADQRKCAKCKRVAVKHKKFCYWHDLSRRSNDKPGRQELRLLQRMNRYALLPVELVSLPVWQNINPICMAQRGPMRLRLLQAFDVRLTEPLLWAKVQREATELALHGDRPAYRFDNDL